MVSPFSVLDRHLEELRRPPTAGKLVLSRLERGKSMITAPCPSLKLVLEGEEIYEVDGRPVRVEPGQFLYLDAGTPCTGSNRSFTTGLCLLLPSPEASTDTEEFAGWDPVLGRALVLSTRTSALGRLLETVGRRIAQDPEAGERLAPVLIEQAAQAVGEPLAESRAAMEGLKAAKASTRRELYQRLERARGFLHSNQDRNVSLTELSSLAGLSQFHLARYFKSAFGKSPISYHRDLRLDRAAMLLRKSNDCRLTDLAESSGYCDEVSLSHAFKRRFGKSPRQWRSEAGEAA